MAILPTNFCTFIVTPKARHDLLRRSPHVSKKESHGPGIRSRAEPRTKWRSDSIRGTLVERVVWRQSISMHMTAAQPAQKISRLQRSKFYADAHSSTLF